MPAKNLQRVAEGGIYCHVYNRGIETRTIFADDSDYQTFLGYLEEYLSAPSSLEGKKTEFTVKGRVYSGIPHQPKNYFDKVELIAYDLKPDHFHLLLHQKTANSLQAFIRSLCTRYSMYFNKKYSRSGTLFNGPYKSKQINGEKNLKQLVSYLNKHNIHTSKAYYSGESKAIWLKTKFALTDLDNIPDDQLNNSDYEFGQNSHEPKEQIPTEVKKPLLERRNPQVEHLKPWARIPEMLGASIVFVVLLGVGYRNVTMPTLNSSNQPTTLGTSTTAHEPTPSPDPTTMPTTAKIEASTSARTQNDPSSQIEDLDKL